MRAGTGRALRMSYIVASVCGIAFFIMSVGLLGVWPTRVLSQETRAMAPEHTPGVGASEQRGRAIYSREGCAYCHTQQVRYLPSDMARFGAPTLAWETRQDYPHLWGTRRIGPDLSRASGTRPADWQFAHLYSPRSIVPGSVMPAYPGLFDGAPDRPRQDARDLLAYLESLGRARALAGPEGEARARQACDCAADEMRQMAFEAGLDVHPGKARSGDDVPALPAARNDTRGRVLYARHCATCHGPAGEGDVGGGMGLLPRPVSLADHAYTTERIAEALWNGVAGTAMPAWRDHPLEDLAAIAHVVRGMTAARPEPTLPADLIEAGPRVYADHCVQCHGERGAGDGTAAKELPIAPTNFQRQRPSLDYALRALREGIAGTPMAPWPSRLSEGEMLAVANYVRSFSAGTLRTTGGSSR